MPQFKNRIIEYAHSIGIDDIRFTTAEPFTEFKLNSSITINGYESGFETGTIGNGRIRKRSANAKSIIHCCRLS